MKRSKIYINIIWVWIIIGIGGLLCPNPAGAFSGITIDPDRIEFIELDADVMEVNVAKAYLVVAEEKFLITDFKIAGKIYQSSVVDAEGKVISFKSLKKGQRVIVKGIKLPNENIAGLVQKIPHGKNVGKDYRFMQKADSLRPVN